MVVSAGLNKGRVTALHRLHRWAPEVEARHGGRHAEGDGRGAHVGRADALVRQELLDAPVAEARLIRRALAPSATGNML